MAYSPQNFVDGVAPPYIVSAWLNPIDAFIFNLMSAGSGVPPTTVAGLFANLGIARGASSAASATSLVVAHGLSGTPTIVTATPNLNTGNWWITAIGATNFTINWVTSSSPTWYWEAIL